MLEGDGQRGVKRMPDYAAGTKMKRVLKSLSCGGRHLGGLITSAIRSTHALVSVCTYMYYNTFLLKAWAA
jgi:hypothetical protein